MSRATEILVAIIIGVIGSLLANFLQARLWATITTGLAGTAVYLLLAFLNERYPKLIGRKVCYASTGVVLRGDKILLIFHPRQKLWLPPGCHLKGTQYPHEAVLKAIERETGYKAEFHSLYDPVNQIDRFSRQVPQPFVVQIEQQLPTEGHLFHYDFIYLLVVKDQHDIAGGVHDKMWATIPELENFVKTDSTYPDVLRIALRGMSIASKHRSES